MHNNALKYNDGFVPTGFLTFFGFFLKSVATTFRYFVLIVIC